MLDVAPESGIPHTFWGHVSMAFGIIYVLIVSFCAIYKARKEERIEKQKNIQAI